jgi:phage FluMu gp28-like protein
VVACGRRFGKTEVGKIMVMERALRGEKCWWLSPTYQMAGHVWRDVKALCRGLPQVTLQETERRISFAHGGEIAFRSSHAPDHLRGAGLDFAVLDEAAFMDGGVWPEVVRPMLLDRQGGALFLSSPNGRNWFWALYQQGLDQRLPHWESFHFTSYDNPLIPAAEFEELRHSTPEHIWQVEYLAQFAENSGQVFRGIRQAATAPTDSQPIDGRRYVAGVDWGREGDYTVIAIMDAESRDLVALDRFNQVSWALQRGRLVALCERWRPAVIWAEENSIGSPNIEALQAEGLPIRSFSTTAKSKPPLIEGLALALERGEIQLLPDETLLGELAAYEMTRQGDGYRRYSAPSGGHDDCVIALALAWYGLKQGGTRIDFV